MPAEATSPGESTAEGPGAMIMPSKNQHVSISEPISDRHERREEFRVSGVPFAGERPSISTCA